MADDTLDARQERFLAALLQEASLVSAAKSVNIAESTARRWLTLPKFKAAYHDARRQHMDHAISLLQRSAGSAVAALLKNLKCGIPAVEIRTAQIIIELGLKGVEQDDLATRIEELERIIVERGLSHYAA